MVKPKQVLSWGETPGNANKTKQQTPPDAFAEVAKPKDPKQQVIDAYLSYFNGKKTGDADALYTMARKKLENWAIEFLWDNYCNLVLGATSESMSLSITKLDAKNGVCEIRCKHLDEAFDVNICDKWAKEALAESIGKSMQHKVDTGAEFTDKELRFEIATQFLDIAWSLLVGFAEDDVLVAVSETVANMDEMSKEPRTKARTDQRIEGLVKSVYNEYHLGHPAEPGAQASA